MTREDIETCFSYHEAGAAMEYYAQEQERLGEIEGDDVVNAFEAGAEWAQKFMINRACGWLKLNIGNPKNIHPVLINHLIDNFRKAMEE